MKLGTLVELLGIINFLLVLFQVSSGLRFLKIPFPLHRKTGLLLFFTALIHGGLAIYLG
ncbi:MAG: hypothetical protein NTV04_11090 [Deltaproteobacteria bacterium]|jgi:hypothetical protein|nr:hypothetical protein [Deltaproteobacteria bacterium]